jgi:fructose-1-phosphate kinase PfkB-like protein
VAKVLVAGLNPAWQQVYSLSSLHPDTVQRAESFHALASGKGLNAAKVLARLGHDVSVLQILAGENGRRVHGACPALGIRSLAAWTDGETRVCTTLLGGGKSIEAIAPFAVGNPSIADELVERGSPDDRYDALLVCGSIPEGLDAGVYRKIVERAAARLVVWDSVDGLSPEIIPRISWVKLNLSEYDGLARAVWRHAPKRPALVTHSSGAEIRNHPEAGFFNFPPLRNPLNPIGAGDTVTAMLTDGILRGLGAREAASRALAAGTASCMHPLPAEWDPADAERLEKKILWTDGARR